MWWIPLATVLLRTVVHSYTIVCNEFDICCSFTIVIASSVSSDTQDVLRHLVNAGKLHEFPPSHYLKENILEYIHVKWGSCVKKG